MAGGGLCGTGAQVCGFFFFNDPATTEIYTLSLHDALPIWAWRRRARRARASASPPTCWSTRCAAPASPTCWRCPRSEEHTSELQSRQYLVCRLLLEKKTTDTKAVLPLFQNSFRRKTTLQYS